MDKQALIKKLEDIMELDSGALTEASVFDNFNSWDSISMLSVIALAQDEYNKSMTIEAFNSIKTVQDLLNYLEVN